MNKKKYILIIIAIVIIGACVIFINMHNSSKTKEYISTGEPIALSDDPIELEDGFSAVQFDGNYSFDSFLEQGGAKSDQEVVRFLAENIIGKEIDTGVFQSLFGCSTISVKSPDGDMLFGRNFDWNKCNAMIVMSKTNNGYHSISTVNEDFIKSGVGRFYDKLPQRLKTIAALYAPLDGMNEKGLVVSVNMIQDNSTIEQNSEKPDLTTTTAVRFLLDKAATTDEAIKLLSGYDLHASMGYMVHFAISDITGHSVCVEYINNEMSVIETPVVTNFYLTAGEKYGIGTEQSHERYDILIDRLNKTPQMNSDDLRNSLDAVSKDNFRGFESTEWSIVFNQTSGEVHYYHRENFENKYIFNVK